eukprot:scaffold14840_cov66-Phaeocystis_antarctica.AAC.8
MKASPTWPYHAWAELSQRRSVAVPRVFTRGTVKSFHGAGPTTAIRMSSSWRSAHLAFPSSPRRYDPLGVESKCVAVISRHTRVPLKRRMPCTSATSRAASSCHDAMTGRNAPAEVRSSCVR